MSSVFGGSGLSPADVAALLAAQNLGDIGTYTLATLPDPALTPKRTCWCSDLFGIGDRMVSSGGAWKPIRPLVTGSLASGNITIQPLQLPTTILLTNPPGAGITHNINLGTGSGFAVSYPGYRQRIVKPYSAFLGTINLLGKNLTGWFDMEWDGAAWQQTASGGLL